MYFNSSKAFSGHKYQNVIRGCHVTSDSFEQPLYLHVSLLQKNFSFTCKTNENNHET